jgi:hypothetical protein
MDDSTIPKMLKIAISYRRTDSDSTGRIFDRLVQKYGRESVFRDIDNIPYGSDFRTVVNDALRDTDVLIVVVGANWLGVAGGQGSARIDDDNDPVRIELETALQRNIPIIPVLVGGATMPKSTELPDSLREFSFRNAANVDSGRNFDTDVERLMRSLDRLLESSRAQVDSSALRRRKEEEGAFKAAKGSDRPGVIAYPISAAADEVRRRLHRWVRQLAWRPSPRLLIWSVIIGIILVPASIAMWLLLHKDASMSHQRAVEVMHRVGILVSFVERDPDAQSYVNAVVTELCPRIGQIATRSCRSLRRSSGSCAFAGDSLCIDCICTGN